MKLPVFVTESLGLLLEDWRKTNGSDPYPVLPLLDAQTMEVIYPDCFKYPQASGNGTGNLVGCVRDHYNP